MKDLIRIGMFVVGVILGLVFQYTQDHATLQSNPKGMWFQEPPWHMNQICEDQGLRLGINGATDRDYDLYIYFTCVKP